VTASTRQFALFGTPLAHSLSPRLHAAFARELGVAIDYQPIETGVDAFAEALASFADAGGQGANVTLPLKRHAVQACRTLGERARRAGAVNTLVRLAEGGWHGENTDGAGLVRDLTGRHALDLRERRTLVLGAGGAACGIVPALLDAGIGELYIVNRDGARADALVDAVGEPARVHSRYFEQLPELGEFDLVVNATSAARHGGLPVLPMSLLSARTAAVDLGFGDDAIAFLAWARAGEAHAAIDGLGMLVEQAAESFEIWHGVRPGTDAVHDAMRAGAASLVAAD